VREREIKRVREREIKRVRERERGREVGREGNKFENSICTRLIFFAFLILFDNTSGSEAFEHISF